MKYQCAECGSSTVIASETTSRIYDIDDYGNAHEVDQDFEMGREDSTYECDYCGYVFRANNWPALLIEMKGSGYGTQIHLHREVYKTGYV